MNIFITTLYPKTYNKAINIYIKVYTLYRNKYILKYVVLLLSLKNGYNIHKESVMQLEEIIDRISKLRTQEGLSARELSLRIGKNEAYINRLEYRKNFEQSISVISDIVESCNSTLEDFFYYDISAFQKDKYIINLLSKAKPDVKDAIIKILENI